MATAVVNGIRMHYRRIGEGSPIVLLHGWPQTGYAWRHVADDLAADHTVIVPDLRGYGRSDKPAGGMDKGTMAADLSALLRELGFERVAVAGHDRGGRVAHRWALDHPAEVSRLALLDIAPKPALAQMNREDAAQSWHWWFHRQRDLPELLVGADIPAYLNFFYQNMTHNRDAITPDAVDEYVRAFSRPGALRCGFDDYRADVIDDVRDEADAAAGRKPEMPMLVLWGEQGALASSSLLSNWQRHAHDVRGQAIADSGHFLPEEAPEDVARELRAFFG